MNLSKSLYIKGLQCPKALWLKKYKKEVLMPPDEAALAVFERGNEVGELACKLFAPGKEVVYTKDFSSMISITKEYIEQGVHNIYEATFVYDGILVLVDILVIKEDGVHIYEVKSSTSVKEIYIHDTYIQAYVLSKLGFNVMSSNLVHINNFYVREEDLDLNELFRIADISQEVEDLQKDIPNVLKNFEKYLDDKINEPNIDIGKHCKTPYACDAISYCWKTQRKIPEYSIFNIFNLGSKKQIELYSQGIIKVEDIAEDFEMTANQKQAVQNYKSKETYINKEKIQEFLNTLTYPIYHLDFETFQQAIPLWEGISPFMQIPFQYSLHIEQENGSIEHKEFLAIDGIDPREELSKNLCKDIPLNVTVLAYNMSFEKSVIKKLARNFPNLSSNLLSINENMKDLMLPFQKKYYVTPSMKGSYSIKYVLPALNKKMQEAYKSLDVVQNGSQAMNAYANLSKEDEVSKVKIRKGLLKYCELDTLAMVKILNKLKEINGKN